MNNDLTKLKLPTPNSFTTFTGMYTNFYGKDPGLYLFEFLAQGLTDFSDNYVDIGTTSIRLAHVKISSNTKINYRVYVYLLQEYINSGITFNYQIANCQYRFCKII